MLQVGPIIPCYLVSSFGQLFSYQSRQNISSSSGSNQLFLHWCHLLCELKSLKIPVKISHQSFSCLELIDASVIAHGLVLITAFVTRVTSKLKITEVTIDIDVYVKSFKAFPLHNFLCYESIYIYYEIVYKLLTNFCRLFVYFCNFRVLFRKTFTKLVNHLYTAVCI